MPKICNTLADVIAVLNDITFKKSCVNFDWTPHVEEVYKCDKDGFKLSGWLVNTTFSRPDIDSGEIGKGPSRQMFVQKGISDTGLFFSYWIAVEKTTIHELMEAIQYKGISVINPHHTLDELSLPQKFRQLAKETDRVISSEEAMKIIQGDAEPAFANHLPTIAQVDLAKRTQERDVHTEHCCVQHGCKYGDEDCPIVTKNKIQSGICERCQNQGLNFRSA